MAKAKAKKTTLRVLPKSKPIKVDWSDEDSIKRAMAAELDIDLEQDDLDDFEEDPSLSSFGEGTVYKFSVGRAEYAVAEDDDAATRLAVAIVLQDLDESPENFEQSFIQSHIDMDRLRRDLHSDVYDMNYERLKEEAERRPADVQEPVRHRHVAVPHPLLPALLLPGGALRAPRGRDLDRRDRRALPMSVLFLDDDPQRHGLVDALEVEILAEKNPRNLPAPIEHTWSADEATSAIDARPYDVVFLDYDLDLFTPEAPSGMTVVDHIVAMPRERRPRKVVVHSLNQGSAPERMMRRLNGHVLELVRAPFASPVMVDELYRCIRDSR